MEEKPLHWSEQAKLSNPSRLPPAYVPPEPPKRRKRGWSWKSPLRIVILLVAFFALCWAGIGGLHLYDRLAGNHPNVAASATSTSSPVAVTLPLPGDGGPAVFQEGAASTSSTSGPPTTSSSSSPANAQPVKAGTPKAWALAASALLTRFNGGRHDLLGTELATPRTVRAEKQALTDWWGVASRDDLLAALDWVDKQGHRAGWDELAAYVASLSKSELNQLLAQVANDPEAKHQVEMVRKYSPTLGEKSLLGWDYARYISLCRWGYICGYLTEKEAWDRIMPVAAMLQKTFSSWADLGENYLIGREFWSYAQMQKDGDLVREAYQWLLSSPTSPWKTNAWDMDLGVVPGNTVWSLAEQS